MTNFPNREMEQSFYEDSRTRSGMTGWIIAIGAAVLIVIGLIYNFGGVSMDHPQVNPAAIQQTPQPAAPTTSPKLPSPTPQ
jgi:hypothetical protein